MCGLVGYVGRGSSESLRIESALDFLHARGPDDRRVWKEHDVVLGHTRLSIIDLATGQQPMTSEDGRHVLVFNGEIYNFRELRAGLEREGVALRTQSDSEVLLASFARQGAEGCLARLRGMFAFAIWDRLEATLTLARDRLGVKPLVYAQTPAGFLFASEIGALFALAPSLSRAPDLHSIDAFLTLQYVPSPRTAFAEVRKLPPAHVMTVRAGSIESVRRYWRVDPQRRASLGFEDASEAVREKLLEATRLRLISDVPLGAFLSGGIDSSITVAAMTRLQNAPVKTFSIGFEEQSFNELPYAREVARHLGTEHHEFVVRADAAAALSRLIEHVGEPLADDSILPTYFVSRETRRHVTVALTGDGGDESFGGYRRFYQIDLLERIERLGLMPLWRELRRITVALENLTRKGRRPRFPATRADQAILMKGVHRYLHLLAHFTLAEKDALYTAEFRQALGTPADVAFLEERYAATAGADPLTRYLLLDLTTFLPEAVLTKVDIASMQNSLECRSPFLDQEMVELAASLPAHYKLRFRKQHKFLLRRAFERWLPRGLLERPKQGFSAPLATWLRDQLMPQAQRVLIGERALARLLRQEQVEHIVRDHFSGAAPSGRRVWALLVLAEWLRIMRVAL